MFYYHKIVSAAPSHPLSTFPTLVIEDFVASEVDIDGAVKALKCVGAVMANAVEGTDLKPLYEQYKQQTESVVKNELLKCRDVGNDAKKREFV